MEDADDAVERVEGHVDDARGALPGPLSHTILVFRPSVARLAPYLVVCIAGCLVGLAPHAPAVVRVFAVVMLLPLIYLGLELCLHRVSVTATTVTDTTWRHTSTTDGSEESYTVLDGPDFPRFSVSRRQHPRLISWTAVDGSEHQVSFQWFRRKDAYAIIAAVTRE